MSMLGVFQELVQKRSKNTISYNFKVIPLDKYLSYFKKEDQQRASNFLYDFMVLFDYGDIVGFQGRAVKYYITKEILKKYQPIIDQQEELKKQQEIKECKALIEETIIDKSLKTKWSDIIGFDDVKQKLQENIVLPTLNPSLFTGLRTPARGVLLYGAPGNGKTMFAKAVASECGKDVSFFNVSSSTFASTSQGKETDKIIKALFILAAEKQPSVIFIDELDSILSKRGTGGETEASRKLKNEFLVQFEGVSSNANERIVVIGATNRPFDLDDAILRRFSVRIYLSLPGEEARKHGLINMMKKVNTNISDIEYLKIAQKTHLFSFADLSSLCREASFVPVREVPPNKLIGLNQKDIRPVTIKDFENALKKVARSVTDETMDQLLKWNKTQI